GGVQGGPFFRFNQLRGLILQTNDGQHDLPYEDINASGVNGSNLFRRLIEHMRTLFRKNDLAGPLPLGALQSLAVPYESYKLAFTSGLAKQIFIDRNDNPHKPRVNDLETILLDEGRYIHWPGDENSQPDNQWWRPSGLT